MHAEEKMRMKYDYEREILKTQLEIQESTLTNISQEIHDNIGQVLSLAKITLARIGESDTPLVNQRIAETRTLIGKAIQDLRDLSKTMHPQYIFDRGLEKSIKTELENIASTELFATSFSTEGVVRNLGPQNELILFRIVQELLNNAVKYSKATNIKTVLTYTPTDFTLYFADDGIGYDTALAEQAEKPGLGMKTIRNRVAMIGANYQAESSAGNGTKVFITLKALK